MSFFQLLDAGFELISEPVVMQEDSTQQCARRKLLSLIIVMENVLSFVCVFSASDLFCKCWSFGYQKFFPQSSGCACNHGWCHRKLQ